MESMSTATLWRGDTRQRRDICHRMAKKSPHSTEVGIRVAGSGRALVHIDDLICLRGSRAPRPLYDCPACNEKVRPRIGAVRCPHFAHASRSDCWALSKEGQLHLEVKHHLARELANIEQQRRAELGLPVRCGEDGSRLRDLRDLLQCSAPGRHAFGEWCDVVVEKRDSLTTRRPDIKLVDQHGDTVLAVEIVHSNAVDEAKAAEFFSSGVRWVEVDISGDGFNVAKSWAAASLDFPATRASVDFAWRCRAHSASEAPLFFRLVDCYFPEGKPWENLGFRRDVYWVVRRWEGGNEVANILWRRRGSGPHECLLTSGADRESVSRAFRVARDDDEVDEPVSTTRDESPWRSLDHVPAGEREQFLLSSAMDFELFPRRRVWSKEHGSFRWRPQPPLLDEAELRVTSLALLERMRGYEKPWLQHPRNPLDVPVIPSGLRGAWLADQLWDALEAHISGQRMIPGVPPFTLEDLWASVRGERPLGASHTGGSRVPCSAPSMDSAGSPGGSSDALKSAGWQTNWRGTR